VTLRFLGEDSRLNQLLVERASAAAASVRMDAFDLVFDRASSFHGPSRLGVAMPRAAEPLHRSGDCGQRAGGRGRACESELNLFAHHRIAPRRQTVARVSDRSHVCLCAVCVDAQQPGNRAAT